MGLPMSDFQARLILQSLETIWIVTSQSKLVEAKKWGLGTGPLPTGKKKYDLKSLSELAIHVLDQKTENSGQKGDWAKDYRCPPVDQQSPVLLSTSKPPPAGEWRVNSVSLQGALLIQTRLVSGDLSCENQVCKN